MMNTEFFGIAPQFLSGYIARKTGPAVRPPQHDPLASAIRAAVLAERRRLSEQHRAKMEGRQA